MFKIRPDSLFGCRWVSQVPFHVTLNTKCQINKGLPSPDSFSVPGVTFPNVTGPTSDWFLDSFQKQFGRSPNYIAAASFATGLVLTECIRRAASLDDEKLRTTASGLDFNTFYGRFRIDSRTGIQTGHRVVLIRWQGGYKVVLPSSPQ
jgi:ABC-type branched-subunit amino acid transport system substrate-binding protein